MSDAPLPERASLEYLKKLAKDRLAAMRRADSAVRLADAQLAVARDHGFPSWRALKAEVDRRTEPSIARFFAACRDGEVETLRALLRDDGALVHAKDAGGATGLHRAVAHPEAIRVLLEGGADPNVREAGDHALPLHFAAAGGYLESVKLLLDAGSEVQGAGDLHAMDAIGWATVPGEPHREVVDLLVARGARHHVFSAIALGDVALLRRVVAEDPAAIRRRLSPFEQEQTALHYVVAPADGLIGGTFRTGEHYRTLEALLALGADVEATDARGRTPLAVAMLRGDREAARLLTEAGARVPDVPASTPVPALAELRRSVRALTPMLVVPEMNAAIAWYEAVGFVLTASHGDGGAPDWASLRFGEAELMLVPSGGAGRAAGAGVSLWVRTERLDEWYAWLRGRQFDRARRELAGEPLTAPEVRFTGDLYTTFYGQREFSVRDPNGVEVCFYQPVE